MNSLQDFYSGFKGLFSLLLALPVLGFVLYNGYSMVDGYFDFWLFTLGMIGYTATYAATLLALEPVLMSKPTYYIRRTIHAVLWAAVVFSTPVYMTYFYQGVEEVGSLFFIWLLSICLVLITGVVLVGLAAAVLNIWEAHLKGDEQDTSPSDTSQE